MSKKITVISMLRDEFEMVPVAGRVGRTGDEVVVTHLGSGVQQVAEDENGFLEAARLISESQEFRQWKQRELGLTFTGSLEDEIERIFVRWKLAVERTKK